MNTNSGIRVWLLLVPFMVGFSLISKADITVKTFFDENNNGIYDQGETLITGLSVHGTDTKGNLSTFFDDGKGTFVLKIVPSRLRVQVSGYNPILRPGASGPTSVFFADDDDVINVPVLKEYSVNSDKSLVLIPCFEKGSAANKTTSPAFVAFPYAVDGVAQQYGGTAPNPRMDATIAQLGSTWGVAYQKNRQRVFVSTILKRHVDLGPEGPGGIYILDYAQNSEKPSVESINLQGYKPTIGPSIDLGAINREIVDGPITELQPYALSTIETLDKRASFDIDAFNKVGQMAYGDADLTEDEKQLWVVNAHQRSLIRLDVDQGEIDVTADKLAHYLIDDIPNAPSTEFRYIRCINVGGNQNINGAEAFTDANHVAWDRNKYGTGGTTDYKFYTPENLMNKDAGTTDAGVYQTRVKGKDFSYNIPIPKEEMYTVTLHFAEPYRFAEGDRLFDVYAEGRIMMKNFDVVKQAGGNHRATSYTFQIEGKGPTLDLDFKGVFAKQIKEAFVNGIEIYGESLMKTGTLRPWGLSFHHGRGYVGLVNDAMISQSRDHLMGWVRSFDPNNIEAGFRAEVEIPLTYPRERVSNADSEEPQALRTAAWLPWVETWEMTHIPLEDRLGQENGLLCSYPQPMISEINFTEDGSMVISLMDRWAHQTGYKNYSTILSNRTLILGYASGDILKAFKEGDSYNVEASNNDDGLYYNKIDGPSYDGEFFYQDEYQSRDVAHHGELVTGGAAVLYGTNEVVTTVHNPIETTLEHFTYNGVFTQGVHFYNTNTGLKTHSYLFVDQFNIGKANGLGDVEFAIAAPSGEVGNYLWCDANSNGIQDPSEFGIEGIELVLHDKENSLQVIDRTTTNSMGGYLFENLRASHCYEIRINLTQLTDRGFSGLTAPTGGGTTDIDSDGDPDMLPGFSVAMFCTDAQATNNHDIDFGFGGPRAQDVVKSSCEDPMTGCATFLLADVASCVDTSGENQVRFFPTFNDADSLRNEITASSIMVCDVDTSIFARVNIPGDQACFSIASVQLTVLNAMAPPQDFETEVCPTGSFDAIAFMAEQGYDGAQTQLFSDPGRMMMIPNPVTISSYPTTIYYMSTPLGGMCNGVGAITINGTPLSLIEAGNDIETCGTNCADLTALGAFFSANGSGATAAQWTSSGTGTFQEDNTFAGARFYCPSDDDMLSGSVILTLSVTDDPCGRTIQDVVTINIVSSEPRFMQDATADTVLCIDPFVDDHINNDTFPRCRLVANCGDTITATVVEYTIEIGNCDDIVKYIIRKQRVEYRKVEYFCTDTIFVQSLDFDAFVCPPERDSVYCHTGYLKDENGHPSPLVTGVPMAGDVPLWPQPNSKCDIRILYFDVAFDSECPMIIKRTWWVKNNCNGRFDTCLQWLMVYDTLGPDLTKIIDSTLLAPAGSFPGIDKPVMFVRTSAHDCDAHTYIPPVLASDTCSGVKLVKAMIPNIGSFSLTYNPSTGQWESHESVKIPKADQPTAIIYEAYDSCHNVTKDTCYFFVKDFTKPVAICDKGINVTISDSTVWLAAEIFDEGSWDNCGVNLILARRSDWATGCGVNLCDSIVPYCSTEHHDTLWCGVLEQDKHINPIEAHYAKNLQWLCEDNQACSELVLAGWLYDLIKYASLECIDHPYPVDDQYIRNILKDPSLECGEGGISLIDICTKLGFDYTENLPEFAAPLFTNSSESLLDVASQIGGGWSKEVPFCCQDACQDVMVELLVMDYWCNWTKCWTTVYVEDKTPPVVVSDLYDVNLSCTSYKEFYEGAVQEAQLGEFTHLDSLLGGYDKVGYDQYKNVPAKTPFSYYNVLCDSILIEKDSLVYDEHEGYQWVSYHHYEAIFDTIKVNRFRGQIADDCGLICIEDEPWVSIDACGNGFVKRVFHFIGQCQKDISGHKIDTITKYQTIWIQSDCNITKSMFTIPDDQVLYNCGLEYNSDGSGNAGGVAHPDQTGWPAYIFDDDCRQVGIGYYDKVFKIVGGEEACYKIIRTWCFADWCVVGEKGSGQWWANPKYDGKYLSWDQKIILLDTIAPVCTIDLPDVIETAACTYNLETEIAVQDECGVIEYSWELYNKAKVRVAAESGQLTNEESSSIHISKKNLVPDSYTLKLIVVDDCQNEGFCNKEFVIVPRKKPTAVCISSLTLNLTSMDLSGDGVIDTAMGTIWASEFNVSSSASCGKQSSKLQFRIDRVADGDPALPSKERSSLTLGCADIGPNAMRLYVLDEAGNWDFCEVLLSVQVNGQGCGDISSSGMITGVIVTELDRIVHQVDMKVLDYNGSILENEEVSGSYRIPLEKGKQAYLVPFKDMDHKNGISTRDLINIQEHLIGKKKVDSWYKRQAADINADGKISAGDLLELRRLILGITEHFPENTSWRFFDRLQNQEQYFINPMKDLMRVDFVAVKIGDINLDGDPSRSAARSAKPLQFFIQDKVLNKGERYIVPVTAKDFKEIGGLQYTFSFDTDKASITSVNGGDALDYGLESFNLNQLLNGWFTSSWFDPSTDFITIPDGTVLFSLELEVREEAKLSDILNINNNHAVAEAYESSGKDLDIALVFGKENMVADPFTLYQNVPNPFSEVTSISFRVPEATNAILTIHDVTGKTLKVIEGHVTRGMHRWEVDREDLPQSGILYYRLDTGNDSSVRKMILITR